MPVEIVDESGGAAGPELLALAERAAMTILESVGHSGEELCVMLVDDDAMRELNQEWRGKDATTDVLSFSQIEGEPMPEAVGMLGDVVVSVDTMMRQAAAGGWSDGEELVRLVLHGVLHLLGFDHELRADAEQMRDEEARVVAELAAHGIACAWEGEAA